MTRVLHIACLQTRPRPDMASAVEEAMPLAQAAAGAGAQMLFLPEFCGGLVSDGVRFCPPADREDRHPVLAAFRDLAARRKIWLQIGSLAVDAPDGRLLNRGYMIGPDGDILGHYDKLHLFDVDLPDGKTYRESDTVAPGEAAVLYETSLGNVGHTICYDLRFPGLYRDLAQAGAEILTCPAAFTRTTGPAHWHVLNRARAIENTRFMVSACAVGEVPGGGESFGHSLIVNPWGEVLADGGAVPGIVQAQIDLDLVPEISARIPSLSLGRRYVRPARAERDAA